MACGFCFLVGLVIHEDLIKNVAREEIQADKQRTSQALMKEQERLNWRPTNYNYFSFTYTNYWPTNVAWTIYSDDGTNIILK